jgi:rare lipoprotein A
LKTVLFIILFLTCGSFYSQQTPFIFKDSEIGCQLDTTKNNVLDVIKSTIIYLNTKCSYYAHFFHGRKTASGSRYNMYDLTCAHKTLPFGTLLRITNLSNYLSVIVTVTDRGPYTSGRTVDLSYGAEKKLNIIKKGIVNCKVEILQLGQKKDT